MLPDHYRYSDVLNESGLIITCQVFQAIKETPCGYWVVPMHGVRLVGDLIARHMTQKAGYDRPRFVLKDSGKRYCYPDHKSAMQSYASRKRWQIKHAENSLYRARHALAAADKMLSVGDVFPREKWCNSIITGMPEEFRNWTRDW